MPELEPFALAGGTALALHFGHRVLFDLDFFTQEDFEAESLLKVLESRNNVAITGRAPFSQNC
ncbi:MAG: nucleotidyl transferase AbiEii/AbiGii toxin family protein [Verrucomicrobiae bacterium]|nr:nucleotidyl transferase AbiEii/AbiGii toxin family protein [Verrucomicrobiae bacterium]